MRVDVPGLLQKSAGIYVRERQRQEVGDGGGGRSGDGRCPEEGVGGERGVKGLVSCGEPREAKALFEEGRTLDRPIGCVWAVVHLIVFSVVHEMATDAIGTEANGMESATGLSLILGVAVEVTLFFGPVGELTFGAVFAHPPFGKRAA